VAKILVVDDEPAIRNLLIEVLEDEGHVVVAAPNGRTALDLAARERPDLVLTDVMMPEIDGLEMLRRLQAAPELAGVPVVLMSAANGTLPANPGAVAFVPKPFDLEHILAVIGRALGNDGH
jgi:CheY-like chemotaxis protein